MTSLEIVLVLLLAVFVSATIIFHKLNKMIVDSLEDIHDDMVDRIEEIEDKGSYLASDDREKQALISVCEKIEKLLD